MQSQIDRSGISSSSVKQLDLVFCDLLVISSIIWKPELYSVCQLPGNVPLLWSSSCSSSKLEIGWAQLLIITLLICFLFSLTVSCLIHYFNCSCSFTTPVRVSKEFRELEVLAAQCAVSLGTGGNTYLHTVPQHESSRAASPMPRGR